MEEEFALYTVLPPGLANASRPDVIVECSPIFDRVEHPSPEVERAIDSRWKELIAKHPKMYNAAKFRFHSMDTKGKRVTLRLGLTDYKTFQGTNMLDWARLLADAGGDTKHLSSSLGNVALVETIDAHIVVLRRSENVAEAPGMFCLPGGHPEPASANIKGHGNYVAVFESSTLRHT